MKRLVLLAAAVAAAAMVAVLVAAGTADATTNPLKTSMVKYRPDYTQVMNSVGTYTWQVCGGPVPGGYLSPHTVCQPGQVPVYTSEAALARDVTAGTTPNGARTVMLDLETWKWTPLSEGGSCHTYPPYCGGTSFDNAMRYTRLGAQLIAAHPGYKLISTPGGNRSPSQLIALVTQAARYASWGSVVELQAQWLTGKPAQWSSFVASALASVRAHQDRWVPFLAGLRPNGATAYQMYRDWKWSATRIQGWWVNADPEGTCAFVGGVSPCSAVIRYFYKAIGVTA